MPRSSTCRNRASCRDARSGGQQARRPWPSRNSTRSSPRTRTSRGRAGGVAADEPDRVPVAPHQLAHRRAVADLGQRRDVGRGLALISGARVERCHRDLLFCSLPFAACRKRHRRGMRVEAHADRIAAGGHARAAGAATWRSMRDAPVGGHQMLVGMEGDRRPARPAPRSRRGRCWCSSGVSSSQSLPL